MRAIHPPAGLAGLTVIAVGLTAFAGASSPDAFARDPSLGRTVKVKRVSGKVRIKPFGTRTYRVLAGTRTIRMGSTVDATRGRVKVTAATGNGRATQSGEFYDGAFTVAQQRARAAVVELKLARGDFSRCGRSARGKAAASRRLVRRLWGKARGRFRTVGRHSAATVRGTTWLTEDFCDTSRTQSREGRVTAAPAGSEVSFTSQVVQGVTFNLDPGQSLEVYCARAAPANVGGAYCLVLLSQPAENVFGFGIVIHSTQFSQYGLCVTGPQPDDCGILPLTAPNADGFRTSAVACGPMANAQRGAPAEYTATWILGGEILPVPIRFVSALSTFSMDCISEPKPA